MTFLGSAPALEKCKKTTINFENRHTGSDEAVPPNGFGAPCGALKQKRVLGSGAVNVSQLCPPSVQVVQSTRDGIAYPFDSFK